MMNVELYPVFILSDIGVMNTMIINREYTPTDSYLTHEIERILEQERSDQILVFPALPESYQEHQFTWCYLVLLIEAL